MAHVVVDQTEGETSIHESQAPLGTEREREREGKCSERVARNPGFAHKNY